MNSSDAFAFAFDLDDSQIMSWPTRRDYRYLGDDVDLCQYPGNSRYRGHNGIEDMLQSPRKQRPFDNVQEVRQPRPHSKPYRHSPRCSSRTSSIEVELDQQHHHDYHQDHHTMTSGNGSGSVSGGGRGGGSGYYIDGYHEEPSISLAGLGTRHTLADDYTRPEYLDSEPDTELPALESLSENGDKHGQLRKDRRQEKARCNTRSDNDDSRRRRPGR